MNDVCPPDVTSRDDVKRRLRHAGHASSHERCECAGQCSNDAEMLVLRRVINRRQIRLTARRRRSACIVLSYGGVWRHCRRTTLDSISLSSAVIMSRIDVHIYVPLSTHRAAEWEGAKGAARSQGVLTRALASVLWRVIN